MRAFTIIDAEQRSDEWFAARLGRVTGSSAGEMLARSKDGKAFLASRRNLLMRLVLERVTGKSLDNDDFVSLAMQAGRDREQAAREAYAEMTGHEVVTTGFLSHNEHMAGCSLDGHVGDFEVLLSIKCRQANAHYEFVRHGSIPFDAMTQIRQELWLTGARKHHYFGWNPDFPGKLRSRLVVVPRAQATVDDYERDLVTFLREVDIEEAAMRTMANHAAVLAEVV